MGNTHILPTIAELFERAERAIEDEEEFVCDTAMRYGKTVAESKGHHWFTKAVAVELTKRRKWASLASHYQVRGP